MLVALIPPPINYFGNRRIIRRSFEFRDSRRAPETSLARASSAGISRGNFGAVVEEELVTRPKGLVDDEEVELIMLQDNILANQPYTKSSRVHTTCSNLREE